MPATTLPTYSDNPYGLTIYANDSTDLLAQQAINDMKTLGMTWLRWQLPWRAIEQIQGVYTWTALDDAVSKCNTAGINFVYSIGYLPSWHLTLNVGTGTNLPGASDLALIGGLVAARYNGSAGHGTIQSIEIGNEEYDNQSSSAARVVANYAPAVIVAVPAIRNAGFTGYIGHCALLGANLTHIQTWLQGLYAAGCGYLLDYLNFHFYEGGGLPPWNSSGDSNTLSIDQTWSIMHQTVANLGDPNKPIWITEFGYATNPNQESSASNVVDAWTQTQYLQYELDSCRKSGGAVKKAFLYTMDIFISNGGGNVTGKSITQGVGAVEQFLPAFYMFQNYIKLYPLWNTSYAYAINTESIIRVSVGAGIAKSIPGIYQYDLTPILYVQFIQSSGSPFNLTGLANNNISMALISSIGGKKAATGSVVIVDATNALVLYHWGYSDTSVSGVWEISFRLDFPEGPVRFDPLSMNIAQL